VKESERKFRIAAKYHAGYKKMKFAARMDEMLIRENKV